MVLSTNKLKLINIITKANANYTCCECGSTENIQAHHKIPKDDSSLISLCAMCHRMKHPNLPKGLFFNRSTQPYWENISASSLAKKYGVVSRTIYRIAKRLNIRGGILTNQDEIKIKSELHKFSDKSAYPKCPKCGGVPFKFGKSYIRKQGVLGKWQKYKCISCSLQWEDKSTIIPLTQKYFSKYY